MAISKVINAVLNAKTSIAPLITFRVLFGLIMFVSLLRFWANGWIDLQYIQPSFHFKFYGFHWVPDLPEIGYYIVFALLALASLGIALGAFYRISTLVFFLGFTYIELVDATYYLNHYYFVSIVAFLLIFLPANRLHSVDLKLGLARPLKEVQSWQINVLKFQLGLVYFLAGVAKLNHDWLVEAMPLSLWLPAQDHLPLIGWIMPYKITAYLFSWGGAIYDLSIPFLLIFRPTRWLAYVAVIAFHIITWSMFQIGMFPFIMIGATLIFFSPSFHQKLQSFLGFKTRAIESKATGKSLTSIGKWALFSFVVFQLVFPFRYVLYPGNPFWHEQGYRFGWRVMLMEKAGYAQFKIQDQDGRIIEVDNGEFLTPVQEKMMATQPDFMLQYADHLKEHYQTLGIDNPSVKADVFVTLNGKASRPFIDNQVDLAALEDGWKHKSWVLPFNTAEQ